MDASVMHETIRPEFRELDRLKRVLGQAGLIRETPIDGDAIEQRREVRINLTASCTCLLPQRSDLIPIMITNLSRHGLQFKVASPVQVGDLVRIIVCLTGESPCQVIVRARWVKEGQHLASSLYSVGASLEERISPF